MTYNSNSSIDMVSVNYQDSHTGKLTDVIV